MGNTHWEIGNTGSEQRMILDANDHSSLIEAFEACEEQFCRDPLDERRNIQFAEGDSRLPTPISAPAPLGPEGRENRAILPCPFCQGTNLTNHGKEIECQDCGALGPLPSEGEVSEEMAVSLWNRRPVANHPDDLAVDRFAAAMKAKLSKKRADGRCGWEGPTCSDVILSRLLREHVEKGDPLDVGNLAMMLHQRGERIK